MNQPKKLKGNTNSEVTRFKALWLKESFADSRDYWREQFLGSRTQADIRSEIHTKLKINLRFDNQLTGFRQWVTRQDLREREAEQAEQDATELTAQGLSGDTLRTELINRMKRRALAQGDWKLGKDAVTLDLKAEQVAVDKRKLVLLEQKAAAYDRAQAALKEAAQTKGGITPETLKRIETELRLL